jgi:hypothetical protein
VVPTFDECGSGKSSKSSKGVWTCDGVDRHEGVR